MACSPYFPDWALEELCTCLDEDTLDLRRLSDIMSEAREDMVDLKALAVSVDDEETYSLDQVREYLQRHGATRTEDNAASRPITSAGPKGLMGQNTQED